MRLTIADLPLGRGVLGICPMPGRAGFYAADLEALRLWRPSLVISLTLPQELAAKAPALPQDLADMGVAWLPFPLPDYGVPQTGWPDISAAAHALLSQGQKVLLHCMGGCGRSGSALLRLMVEAGEAPALALQRLRQARPCAVETDAQYHWATTL